MFVVARYTTAMHRNANTPRRVADIQLSRDRGQTLDHSTEVVTRNCDAMKLVVELSNSI